MSRDSQCVDQPYWDRPKARKAPRNDEDDEDEEDEEDDEDDEDSDDENDDENEEKSAGNQSPSTKCGPSPLRRIQNGSGP